MCILNKDDKLSQLKNVRLSIITSPFKQLELEILYDHEVCIKNDTVEYSAKPVKTFQK